MTENTIITPTLALLNPSVTEHEWIHYSTEPRSNDMDIKLKECYNQKAPEALHFAIGNQWVEFCDGSMHKVYTHKYRLANFADLKLLEISSRTVTQLLPLPLASWGINWSAIKARGYDGVYVHHDDIYYHNTSTIPGGYGRWKTFTHCFDVDTLVIWRGAKLETLTNDWPALTDEQIARKAKQGEYEAKLAAEREAAKASMTDEERAAQAAEAREANRRSTEIQIDKNAREVDWLRSIFPGYNEHYPCKPPNCTTSWPQAFEDK